MKKTPYLEAQIVSILKEADNGVPVSDCAGFMEWAAMHFTNGDQSMVA